PKNLARNIRSVFAELFVPIFGAANAVPGSERRSPSRSGRNYDYSDFGSTCNPKIWLTWNPLKRPTIRGTYGRSFRAPGVRQVGATVGSVFYDAATAAIVARDPTRGDAQVNTIQLIGGNRNLQPEEARTSSVGFDWLPNFLPDFGASVTF